MKKKTKNTKLKKMIIWLLVALLIIVGFFGVYTKKLNRLTNVIPDYNLGMDIKGNREFNLVIDNSEEEKTVYVDNEGNIAGEVIDEEKQVDGYTIEPKKIKVNNEENLTAENYEKTKEIIEERIKKIEINEYNIKLNNQTGNIVIEFPQNDNTDNYYTMSTSEGKFEIVDRQNGIVLINNNEIISAVPVTNQNTSGGYDIYLQVEFTDDGAEKLKEISNKYIEYIKEGEEETTIDEISVKLDGTELYHSYFGDEWTSNLFQIPLVSNITEQSQMQEAYNYVDNIATIIDTGKLPIKYSLESDEFIKATITDKNIEIAKFIIIGILILITLVFTIKYKLNGLKLGIINLGFLALYSILIRYLKIEINKLGFVSIIVIIIINSALYYNILKNNVSNKDFNKKIKEFTITIIPFIIIAIIFTLTKDINTLSIGMLTFWGIAISEIYNLIVLKNV